MAEIALVGLVSSYREGRLIQGALRGLLPAVDRVYLYEGPAGDPLHADVPATELGELADDPRLTLHEGRWRTDARKRQSMVDRARNEHEKAAAGRSAPAGGLWGIWLDGDELLFNGEYLRDWLQVLQWEEEQNPEQPPYLGRPFRMVELDGSVSWTLGRVIRVDLIQRLEVSSATFVNVRGVREGRGNVPDMYSQWAEPRVPYFEQDRLLVHPPIPGEPHVLHRSALRHPLRRGLRMHHQEAAELDRLELR